MRKYKIKSKNKRKEERRHGKYETENRRKSERRKSTSTIKNITIK